MNQRMLAPIAAALALLPLRAQAAETHLVPQDHATIQAAVDAAANGDTILISAGTYAEAVVVTNKDQVVIQGKGKVVIDPPGDGGVALTLDGCDDSTFSNIRTTGADIGIRIFFCERSTVSKCRVEAVLGTGMLLESCSMCTVERCTITDAGGDGLVLGELSLGCHLFKNRIERAGVSGITVSNNANVISKNLIIEPQAFGCLTDDDTPATGNTFTGNKIIGAGEDGFRVQGNDNTFVQNTVVGSGNDGFQIADGTGHVVQGCKVVKCAGDGLLVADESPSEDLVSHLKLLGNTFLQSGGDGAEVTCDVYAVDANRAQGAGGDGFVAGGTNGVWTGNVASGSGDDGFDLTGLFLTMTENKATGSKAGFDLNDQAGWAFWIGDSNVFKTQGP